jgi:hypothetical protein
MWVVQHLRWGRQKRILGALEIRRERRNFIPTPNGLIHMQEGLGGEKSKVESSYRGLIPQRARRTPPRVRFQAGLAGIYTQFL